MTLLRFLLLLLLFHSSDKLVAIEYKNISLDIANTQVFQAHKSEKLISSQSREPVVDKPETKINTPKTDPKDIKIEELKPRQTVPDNLAKTNPKLPNDSHYNTTDGISYKIHDAKGSANLLNAANAPSKGGLTAVGRALQKHGSRSGSLFPKATGNATSMNAQGKSVLQNIVSHPNASTVIRHHGRFGNIVEIKIPNGQGARFSADGKTFFGFIE